MPGQPVIERFVTRERLGRGLWSSANSCGKCLMGCGGILLLFGSVAICANEACSYYHQLEIEEAFENVRSIPCDVDANFPTTYGTEQLLHLKNCPLSQLEVFSSATPGLEELENFKENLPPGGVPGSWFSVSMEQQSSRRRGYGRRRSSSWDSVARVSNLKEVSVDAKQLKIGDYRASAQVVDAIPGAHLPLKKSKNCVHETSLFGAPAVLSSSNMQVHGGYTLYSGDPTWSDDGDVRVWFTVGSASPVSVLASQSVDGELVEWTSGQGGGEYGIAYVKNGSVPADVMLSSLREEYEGEAVLKRITWLCLNWAGFFMFLFPQDTEECLDRHRCNLEHNLGALSRALVIAIVVSLVEIGTSWLLVRYMLACVAAAVVIPVCCLYGTGFLSLPCPNQGNYEVAAHDEESEESDEEVDHGPGGPSGASIFQQLAFGGAIGMFIAVVVVAVVSVTMDGMKVA